MNPRSVQSDVTAQYSTEGGQFCFIIFGYTMNNAHIEMTQIKKKNNKKLNWVGLHRDWCSSKTDRLMIHAVFLNVSESH